MAKDWTEVVMEGIVTDILWWWTYRVKVEGSDHEVLAYASWKMKKFQIKIIAWDKVQVSLNPYDITKWRILFRTTWSK